MRQENKLRSHTSLLNVSIWWQLWNFGIHNIEKKLLPSLYPVDKDKK